MYSGSKVNLEGKADINIKIQNNSKCYQIIDAITWNLTNTDNSIIQEMDM
jgi:hypothetical protein